jgi:PAS domain-containing protein
MMDIYLKIGGVIFSAALFGWGAYYWLNENILKPVTAFKADLAESKKMVQAIIKDYSELSNLKANEDGTYKPLIQKLNDNQILLQRIADVQEAKFELDHQGYFECNSSGFLINANDNFCELLKMDKSDCYAYKWMGVINDQQQEHFIEKWERFVRNGIDLNEEVRMKNGHNLMVSARKKPYSTKDARLILGTIKISA